MSGWTVVLIFGVAAGTFYLTREWMLQRGPVTQAEEAAGIINAIGNLGQGIGSAVKSYQDVVGK